MSKSRKARASQVLCTVGTSLFYPNLAGLPKPEDYGAWIQRQPAKDREYLTPECVAELRGAYRKCAWRELGRLLRALPASTRLLGAEINSIDELCRRGHVVEKSRWFFLYSDTEDGRRVAEVLQAYYGNAAAGIPVRGLDDGNPEKFRTQGLRTLAKELGRIIRDQGASNCAINATGGYKAQIAIAVVVGQVTGVPVYYKHERFSAIISLPPLPIAFDLAEWFRASEYLFWLSKEDLPARLFPEEAIRERSESLVDRVEIDGEEYLTLSPLGQIFHDTFRDRYEGERGQLLPPPADPRRKKPPRIEVSGHLRGHPEVEAFLRRITDEIPQVVCCRTFYYNPDLPEQTRFRLSPKGVEGIFSRNGYTAKFCVETTAEHEVQRQAMVAELNRWLAEQKL